MKKELKRDIGQRMRKIRKSLGLTQEQMVSHFDIGRANYSRIEKGEVHPGATILNTLRTKFNVSLDWLISNNGNMFLNDQNETVDKIKYDFGQSTEEVEELLDYMYKVPMVRHAILGFFLEYKLKNRKIITDVFEEFDSSENTAHAQGNHSV